MKKFDEFALEANKNEEGGEKTYKGDYKKEVEKGYFKGDEKYHRQEVTKKDFTPSPVSEPKKSEPDVVKPKVRIFKNWLGRKYSGTDLSEIREIDCSNQNLTSMNGIDLLTNLEFINCSGNLFSEEHKKSVIKYCKEYQIKLKI